MSDQLLQQKADIMKTQKMTHLSAITGYKKVPLTRPWRRSNARQQQSRMAAPKRKLVCTAYPNEFQRQYIKGLPLNLTDVKNHRRTLQNEDSFQEIEAARDEVLEVIEIEEYKRLRQDVKKAIRQEREALKALPNDRAKAKYGAQLSDLSRNTDAREKRKFRDDTCAIAAWLCSFSKRGDRVRRSAWEDLTIGVSRHLGRGFGRAIASYIGLNPPDRAGPAVSGTGDQSILVAGKDHVVNQGMLTSSQIRSHADVAGGVG
ncbi:hypothetical protein F25303_11631 [Fusarium sp. NRRL 25303]|nr:hypothetical protein F25303_11631 [Fusarium sp. NRRL 25303]